MRLTPRQQIKYNFVMRLKSARKKTQMQKRYIRIKREKEKEKKREKKRGG